MNVNHFQKMYQQGEKISMVTCYDYPFARLMADEKSGPDILLIGDSVAMVVHGHKTTINATLEMMVLHTQAVARGAGKKFVLADMPFLSYRKGLKSTMEAVTALMQAGAHAIKIERAEGNEKIVRHIVDSGVPVMGHIGLTPQSVHALGGYKVQGRSSAAADHLLKQAYAMQAAGCFALVIECVPAKLAGEITAALQIPTIGIGAGPQVSGQVMVLHDLLGIYPDLKPKFAKQYFDGATPIQNALNQYDQEVKAGLFPTAEYSFT